MTRGFPLFGATLALLLVGSSGARAGGWMFCTIASADLHTVTVTNVFETQEGRQTIEDALVAEARRARGASVVAQCPLANPDRQAVVVDRAKAIAFNHRLGNIVDEQTGTLKLR